MAVFDLRIGTMHLRVWYSTAAVIIPVDVLTLASSIPNAIIVPGAASIDADVLNLAGSVPDSSVGVTAVSMAFDVLSLASSLQDVVWYGENVEVLEEILVVLTFGSILESIPFVVDALELAGSCELASVVPGEASVVADSLTLASSLLDSVVLNGQMVYADALAARFILRKLETLIEKSIEATGYTEKTIEASVDNEKTIESSPHTEKVIE